MSELRHQAATNPDIDYVAPARLSKLTPAPTFVDGESGAEIRSIDAKQIVAATAGVPVRVRLLGLSDSSVGISFMGGIVLHDVKLPVEGLRSRDERRAWSEMPTALVPTALHALDAPASAALLRRDKNALMTLSHLPCRLRSQGPWQFPGR